MYGFMGQILRVDLTSGNITVEPLPEKEARRFLGGSGLAYLVFIQGGPAGC